MEARYHTRKNKSKRRPRLQRPWRLPCQRNSELHALLARFRQDAATRQRGGWILLANAVHEENERLRVRYLRQLADAEQRIEDLGGFRGRVRPQQKAVSDQIDMLQAKLDRDA